jgi:hypothetical protein
MFSASQQWPGGDQYQIMGLMSRNNLYQGVKNPIGKPFLKVGNPT